MNFRLESHMKTMEETYNKNDHDIKHLNLVIEGLMQSNDMLH